jgi:hypothetical protein
MATAIVIAGSGVAFLYTSGRLDWPFAVRYSDAAFADPQFYSKLTLALCAIAGALLAGGVLILFGLMARRLRAWILTSGALVIIGFIGYFGPALMPLAVEAFPTTYYRSPTGYSAASIVQGAAHYATHCAACHGRTGRGDGPGGRFLRVKPSDLTADHVYSHTDVMPDFRAALGEQARWNVIDFVRANADAARLKDAPAKVTNVGYRAPDFVGSCPNSVYVRRNRQPGRITQLVVAGQTERLRAIAEQELGRDVTVIAVMPRQPTDACSTDDADLLQVLVLYRGGGPIEGAQFLIDTAGLIRAMWYPGGKPNWSVPDELKREIAAIRDNPAANRPRGSHHAR